MKYAKDVRDEWKQYLYLWANGPLCSKGKPPGLARVPLLVSCCCYHRYSSLPHQGRRSSPLELYRHLRQAFKNEGKLTLEEMTAGWYKRSSRRCSPKMDVQE